MVARWWSRPAAACHGVGLPKPETPGKRTNKPEPRLRGDIMRGLNMGAKIHITPQFNAQHYATPAGVRIYFCIFPGVSPLARLHARAILWRPLTGLKKSAR